MPGADDCAIAFRQGMLDVLKLDTLPPEWEPMVKERVVQAIAEDPELAHDIMYADPDVTKAGSYVLGWTIAKDLLNEDQPN